MKENKIINIGIVAHVDAGKTTITERILHHTGRIRSLGSVDKGTSQTDSLDIEKERGISVKLSSASVEWQGTQINLIDTPGHIDFAAEVSRSLLALDCAVVVLSAVEGVQAHTENIWQGLKNLNIPVLFFINKVDRIGADVNRVADEIKKELTGDVIELQTVVNAETDNAEISEQFFGKPVNEIPEDVFESLVSLDENLTEKFLDEQSIKYEELSSALKNKIAESEIFPLLLGSAKFGKGIETLLNFITEFMPAAKIDIGSEPTGIVYKVEQDKTLGRLASIRLFSGVLKNRDTVLINKKEAKITQIKKIYSSKIEDAGEVKAGDTAIICGIEDVRPGNIIGRVEDISAHNIVEPFLTVKAEPKNESDYAVLVSAMQQLADEDPALDLLWLKDERELHIKVMGKIQLEILENILLKRFDIEAEFGKPIVIYKETPVRKGEGFEAYTMPKPCWAVVKFIIEPGEPGSGVLFESEVGVNDIAHRYQQEVKRTISTALKQGPLGWEVTDIKITLVDGEDHNVHSRAGDFVIATPMAIMNGLVNTGTKLLEPMLEFTITAPEEFCGKVISGLSILRAETGNPEIENSQFRIKGIIPVATSMDYSTTLSSITGGKGKISTRFHSYRECPLELGETIPFRGISPLERAKYILKARGAMQ